jgi:dolichol-phosphate mannosyltransferase
MTRAPETLAASLEHRERYRDWYRNRRDPIAADRLLWRAQTFRQLVHLLPGQSVLELGAGDGAFTTQLARVTRGENPITAVRFGADSPASAHPSDATVTLLHSRDFPWELAGRRFDLIVALDLLDERSCGALLQQVHEFLVPGGQCVFFESNPWNPVLRLRRLFARFGAANDRRRLMTRPQLYELASEVGLIRVFSVYTDFVYAPLTRRLAWLLRNLSILLENAPGVRVFAGAILLHAQKPPRVVSRPEVAIPAPPELRGAVSVVIPCHNEEMNIRPLVAGLTTLYGEFLHEIIPVDDSSTDGTRAELERLAEEDPRVKAVFRAPPNGVGRALADGYRAATGRWILSMDCDFQHLLPEVRDLFDAVSDGCDVVVGSRFSRHSILLNYPFQKIVANRAFHALARLVLRRDFRDLTNNLKLMRREVAARLLLLEPGFAANAETGLQPLVMGARMIEVPISWINRTPEMGTSSFRLAKVGGGYWRVLRRLAQRTMFGGGAYASLPVARTRAAHLPRGHDVAPER